MIKLPKREKHCDLGVIQNGKCVSMCIYNMRSNYMFDCIGNSYKGKDISKNEIPLGQYVKKEIENEKK